ncbi:phosphatase 2C-like domain-containing protein [Tribonema minus]|uniref:Phosphatase 2C-like domain-containing protein n=1 Tax=Tribonema minus TaxID=303371 RepID=A0A836CMW2_9STRA|nr:phosphatase 2C-like domain-containing protein [Tribonema minus]
MESKQISCFAVFDGHGGSRCSQWLADNLEEDLRCADSWRQEGLTLPKRLKGALVQALKRAEYKYLDLAFKESDHSGACVVVGLYCEGHVCVANVGDCLAVLYLPGADSHVDLSVAHRSRQPEEARRIEAAGGLVINNRAFGVLEPSRSIGDLDLKRHCRGAVTADPYIREVVIPPPQQPAEGAAKKKPALQEAPFLLFASDGLWDVVAAPVVVDLTKKSLKVWRKKPAKSNPARQLVRAAIRHGTMDDTTAIVVHFDAW